MTILNKLISLVKYRGVRFPRSLQDPSELDWPADWGALHYDDIPKFTRELYREICKAHVLHNAPACALGRKSNADDFLFQIEVGAYNFARVHLTWNKERDPTWPNTKLYPSFETWLDDEHA